MNNLSLRFLLLLFTTYGSLSASFAQTDSVIVAGRIRNLTARLYREAPTVFVSRNNILQTSRELARPAPLNVDGTFRVSMPLIFPQEEMYFTYGRISTAFLASAGTLSIDIDADSLFTTAVPFRFGGINAQVNGQFARYKAFEATYPTKPDGKKLSEQVNNASDATAYQTLVRAYQAPFEAFSAKERPFPLLKRWVGYANRYDAAAFLYEKATFENAELSKILSDSLRPANDQLLTSARTVAMNRFADYATQRVTTEISRARGLTVRALAILLERYGKNLTAEERIQLSDYAMKNSARAADLRFFDGLIKRSPDTLQRLVNYELMIQRSIRQFDSTSVDYLAAAWFVRSPGLTLNFARLLYDYARPQVTDPQVGQSMDELYRLDVQDSTRIRTAIQTLRQAGARTQSLEISPNVFITRDNLGSGSSLLDQVINANRGKVLFLLVTSPTEEESKQTALRVQRLRDLYQSRDFALIYVPIQTTDKSLWPEIAAHYNLAGDHLLLTNTQLFDVLERLRSGDNTSATIINRTGKIVKRNVPLSNSLQEIKKEIDKNL